MPLGYARARLGYEKMPFFEDLKKFAGALAKATGYIVLDKHIPSKIILLGKNKEAKKRMKIKKSEI
jgi:wyosine [tRNA(Phe)-imidazoG37] synthetase (radical SAM superfamily)